MPMRSFVGLRVLWSACLSVAALLVAAAPAGAIVGGAVTSIYSAPWTAAVLLHDRGAADGQFCGAAVRDATHVMTAAHCVFDGGVGDAARPAGQLDVLVGK